MSKVKWLSIAVIGLLLINLVIVSTILLKKNVPPGGNMRHNPKEYIIEKLGFDNGQKADYEKIVLQHRNAINEQQEKQMLLKNKLYTTLADDALRAEKDSLEIQLLAVQKEIEDIHYNHFIAIKQICRPAQITFYNSLSKEFAGFFMPPKPPPHPPEK